MKRICCAMLATVVLLCHGCGLNYDTMTTAEILARATKCSEEQAQTTAAVLEQCGAGTLRHIEPTGTVGRAWVLACAEDELLMDLNTDKSLRALQGRGCLELSMFLYNENEVRGTLISSPSEREYYLDTTLSMIHSIEPMLTTKRMLGGAEEVPGSFDYDGERFVYRTLDGIVHAGAIIYGRTERQNISFTFEAEYAMLSPVSLYMDIPVYAPDEAKPDGEFIKDVWNSVFYEQEDIPADALRAAAASRTSPFTEDEIQNAVQAVERYEQY